MIEELKAEAEKYRKSGTILNKMTAEAFEKAIILIKKEGIRKTYFIFIREVSKCSVKSVVGNNKASAYNHVIGMINEIWIKEEKKDGKKERI
jgi:hypothetical protein